jgi:hypothetical protein
MYMNIVQENQHLANIKRNTQIVLTKLLIQIFRSDYILP